MHINNLLVNDEWVKKELKIFWTLNENENTTKPVKQIKSSPLR